ncbi:ATP-binding cassette sub-family C member 2-like [Haemaphysalis longicornis]
MHVCHQTTPCKRACLHCIHDRSSQQADCHLHIALQSCSVPAQRETASQNIGPASLLGQAFPVGVVGRTGAGKSSLVLALLRALTASEGRICIDGVDIASVPLQKLRTVVTVIPQDPCLMRGPLRDILDPARQHSDEELWRALDEAHLKEFVRANPDNLFLTVEDGGSNLSTGQQQLVSLARALLRSPRVLLLDEATSHMDGDTDKLIQATLRKSFARCTVLTIAHRLHTVLDYDKILVMAGGRVVEFGATHDLASNQHSVFHSMLQRAGLAHGYASNRKQRLSSVNTRP